MEHITMRDTDDGGIVITLVSRLYGVEVETEVSVPRELAGIVRDDPLLVKALIDVGESHVYDVHASFGCVL